MSDIRARPAGYTEGQACPTGLRVDAVYPRNQVVRRQYSDIALMSLIITDIWQWTPFIFIIVLAGLQSIPSDVIEASKIDGATWLQQTLLVKLPMIKSVPVAALLMRIVDVYKVVEVVFILTEGSPGLETELLALHVYKVAFNSQNLGYALAISMLLLGIVTLLSIAVLKFSNPMKTRSDM